MRLAPRLRRRQRTFVRAVRAAARFARALERAAAPSGRRAGENGSIVESIVAEAASRRSARRGIREQLPHWPRVAVRADDASAFMVNGPMPIDTRAWRACSVRRARQVDADTRRSLPEHDVTLQIVQSMRMQFRDGIGEAVLKLKPEHLGAVSISLRIENGGLKANGAGRCACGPPVARVAAGHAPQRARRAHLRLDRFDVEPDGQRQATRERCAGPAVEKATAAPVCAGRRRPHLRSCGVDDCSRAPNHAALRVAGLHRALDP